MICCVCVNRELRGPLPQPGHLPPGRERLQAVPLHAAVHRQQVWGGQVPLLPRRRVFTPPRLLLRRGLHMPVGASSSWPSLQSLHSPPRSSVCPFLLLSSSSCSDGSVQPSCYTCDTNEYCANGQCSINPTTRLPECRWDPWMGVCAHVCIYVHIYLLNNLYII